MSLNTEFLGLNRGDLPPTAVSPPPLYPALLNKPSQIHIGEKEKRALDLHRSFRMQFRSTQDEISKRIDMNFLPRELRIGLKKRSRTTKSKEVKRSRVDLEKQLLNLENKEKAEDSDQDGEDDKKSGSEDEAGDEGEEVEGEDEEMDGGTDYANNYFDNGEGEDEEDNLEEGGVY